MHFERPIGGGPEGGAMPGIKFALGENPKQSNWGDRNTTRYPQTRMGVEMLIRDRFTAAREYLRDIKAGKARRDLELEAIGEILEGKRLVHCHSYRQDEILMLCRVAEEFGFRIGTFQHILEGYKVADELIKWSGGGSAFSDWWGYKWEVFDAIPSAGPIMAEQGVIVSYNSDSDEMARRLNIEAGKAAKYSGKHGGKPIPPHEAFKFVTLNPAKQLQMHARTGSLEPGKDADLALWSGIPTSPTSRCEMTWVDGRRLFSLEQDAKQRQWIASERQRLVQKVLAAGQRRGGSGGGAGDDSAEGPDAIVVDTGGDTDDADVQVDQARRSGRRLLLLDSVRQADDWRASQYMNLLLRGLDPRWMRAGDCGCGMTGGEQ
jgi:N-acetylglucosamine-6-phosphate deacetylase